MWNYISKMLKYETNQVDVDGYITISPIQYHQWEAQISVSGATGYKILLIKETSQRTAEQVALEKYEELYFKLKKHNKNKRLKALLVPIFAVFVWGGVIYNWVDTDFYSMSLEYIARQYIFRDLAFLTIFTIAGVRVVYSELLSPLKYLPDKIEMRYVLLIGSLVPILVYFGFVNGFFNAFSNAIYGPSDDEIQSSAKTNQTRLITHGNRDFYPDLSPDGTKIAFSSDRDGNFEIYTMNADGTNQTNVSNSASDDMRPSWSPDGTKIVFTSEKDGNAEIYVMNADGTNQTNVSNNALEDGLPSWSPDGTKIVFSSYRDGNWEIYTMNADGTNQTNISNSDHVKPMHSIDLSPDWSPDGTKIAFSSWRDGHSEIYIMNTDGTNQTNITNTQHPEEEPSWSPDGTKIAYVVPGLPNINYMRDIWIMDIDGSNQKNITNTNNFDESDPSWSPDGTKIVINTHESEDRAESGWVKMKIGIMELK